MCLESPFTRADFLKASTATGLGTAAALAPMASFAEPQQLAQAGPRVPVKVRWLGGGVAELATADDKQIMLVDAWIWNNAGYDRFNLKKPPELSSAAAYADHLVARKPEAILVLLTHDHGDHIGDYFELLKTLHDRGLNVKSMGHSDLLRYALIPKFKEVGLDEAAIVVNSGAGGNIGGVGSHGGMRAVVVPAFHSTTFGLPSIGFVAQIGGLNVYASGDTDLFGDMALIGRRYKPDLAIVCAGNGPFTMGPADAAEAVRMLGVSVAIPVHYAHNALVIGTEAGDRFKTELARISPRTRAIVMKPGETTQV
ncbi:MAG: MBL fold metallo-hydrolase [Vulcanimicrobiaceae bacterium]|jgi:L-ascorbate metabolism protein UlaG (beta-lactamase superfamily)